MITVDVEFFDSAFLFRGRAADDVPEETRAMGIEGIEYIASLLQDHGVRGTFFTLGEVAEQVPDTIADLKKRGHEVASHGYSKSHPDLRDRDDGFINAELVESKRVLESVTGDSIEGFRAPAFAFDERVLETLAEVGYAYDSSIVPSRPIPGFYGSPEAPTNPFTTDSWFSTPGLMEFPVATAPWFRLPIGGAWIRLLGRRYTNWAVRNHLQRHQVTVVYIHPWELVDVPRYDPIPKRVTWRTGTFVRETLSGLVANHASDIQTLSMVSEELRIEKGDEDS